MFREHLAHRCLAFVKRDSHELGWLYHSGCLRHSQMIST